MNETIEYATLITILCSTFAIILSMFGMFLWVRSEANSDRRNFQGIQREDRKDLLNTTRNLELILQGIQQEMKDFHSMLCDIEECKKRPRWRR